MSVRSTSYDNKKSSKISKKSKRLDRGGHAAPRGPLAPQGTVRDRPFQFRVCCLFNILTRRGRRFFMEGGGGLDGVRPEPSRRGPSTGSKQAGAFFLSTFTEAACH